jgi:hypothetical protein
MKSSAVSEKNTYEYHSHALYSAVMSRESVRMPEWEVLDAAMSANSVT